ncbi:MAG: hypothetical protein H5T86_08775, partial [Armatimonadetes bacterium]|nr:hypothetical protein [Armatimonadota bacterium]
MAAPRDLVLWRSGRDYFAAGRRVFRIVGGGWDIEPELQIYDGSLWALLQGRRRGRKPQWLKREPKETLGLLRAANAAHLAALEEKAISLLRE